MSNVACTYSVIDFSDGIPPAFNLQAILKETPFVPDSLSQTISVDILVISGDTSTAVTEEPNVFYETDVVGIIHRSKEEAGELVSNRVWIWRGRNAIFGEKEERKARDLAERYGTTAVSQWLFVSYRAYFELRQRYIVSMALNHRNSYIRWGVCWPSGR